MRFDAAIASSALEYLRREALVRDVLRHLRGEELPPDTVVGRYDFLWRAISPELGETTSTDEWQLDEDHVRAAWRRTCEQHAQTLSFWHGLAVVQREWALEAEEDHAANREAAATHWRLSTGILRHLLCCPDFWRLAADGRGIEPDQLPSVRDEMLDLIITEHLDRANRYRLTGHDAARLHADCLRALAKLDLDEPQEDTGVTPDLDVDEELLREVRRAVGDALDNWASQWIFTAEQILIDADRCASQPSGINKAYPDAIDHMMGFVDLVPDNARASLFILRQYNRYANDAIVADRDGLFEDVMRSSAQPAELLAPFASRGEGGAPANVALCERLVFCALTDCTGEEKVRYLQEALSWNPGDRDAMRLLEQAKNLSIKEELDAANELVDQESYEAAEEKLSALEAELGEAIEPIRQIRARMLFQQAEAAGAEYRFEEAAEKMGRARELVPYEQIVVQRAEMFAEFAAEADDFRALFSARDALQDNDIVRAIRLTEPVAPDFSRYYDVRQLRAGCCFREAVRRANDREQFEAANALMNAAVELDSREQFFKDQREALRGATVGFYFKNAKDAADREDFDLAATCLRRAANYAPPDQQYLLLEQAREASRRAREQPYITALQQAHAHMQSERFAQAIPLLEGIPRDFSQYDAVRHLMWQACFAEGIRLANDRDDLAGARRLLDRALHHADDQNREMVRKQLELVTAALNDGPYVGAVNDAVECMKQQDFARALTLLETVPSTFSQYDAVKHLLWQACLGRAQELASGGQLRDAKALVERALSVVDADNRAVVERHARDLQTAIEIEPARDDFERGVQLANDAIARLSSGDTSAIGDLLNAREHLQTARDKAPNVSIIKEQLDAINDILRKLGFPH